MDFKPSQVRLGIPPLVGTMRSSEVEAAAALLVRACQARGDTWAPIKRATIGEVILEDLDAGHEWMSALNRNPFFRPDFQALLASAFARFVGTTTCFSPFDAVGLSFEFTEAGFEALSKHLMTARNE